MKLEQLGAPLPSESPERKYASLHRTIEAGVANDRTWYELVHTCLTLRKAEEAVTAAEQITEPATRERADRLLMSRGAAAVPARQEVRPASSQTRTATMRAMQAGVDDDSVAEDVVDAFRFLFTDQMPLTVIFATLTFPLVVGLGGFLTRDSHALLFPLIAMIPALSVIGLIGALGRRILIDASKGLDDPPSIPGIGPLSRDAVRFLVDSTLLGLLFLAPSVLLTRFTGVSPWICLAALALGVFTLPMAMALRQVRNDWRALVPDVLGRAIQRGGLRYAGIAGCSALLFAPAAISGWCASGTQLYLQVSIVGPLLVAPLFVVARLLGQFVHTRRRELGDLLGIQGEPSDPLAGVVSVRTTTRRRATANVATAAAPTSATSSKPPAEPAPVARPAAVRTANPLAAPLHPESKSAQRAPVANRPAAVKAKRAGAQKAPAAEGSGVAGQRPTAASPRPRQREAATATPADAPTTRRTRVEVEEIHATESTWKVLPDDLSQIPGACVVSGVERSRSGAAAGGA